MIDRAFSVIAYIWASLVSILDDCVFPGLPYSLWDFFLSSLVFALILLAIHKLYDFGGVSK